MCDRGHFANTVDEIAATNVLVMRQAWAFPSKLNKTKTTRTERKESQKEVRVISIYAGSIFQSTKPGKTVVGLDAHA